MRILRRSISYGLCLFFWIPGKLTAQQVIYSESFNNRTSVHYRVIGKTDNFYWEEKQVLSNNRRRINEVPVQQSFRLYDAHLRLLKEIPALNIPGVIKQWLLAGQDGLYRILLTSTAGKTNIISQHFSADGLTGEALRPIDSLPFTANPSRFILLRSEDQSKILLIAFENTASELTRVNALLFNADWTPVYHQAITQELFSQPCIQDEEIGFVSESFDNLPVKLANNGEWLMAFPSRTSRNLTLFHCCADGSDYSFREISLSPYYHMEDIAMSVDNEQQKMSVGFLSAYKNSNLKNVQVCNYSISEGRFDFDTAYHFTTRFRSMQTKNLSHESFISVAGSGYMLLKEYGPAAELSSIPDPLTNAWETAFLLANYTEPESKITEPGYKTNRGLSPIPFIRNRGDLNIFYFPALSRDSTWSGTLDVEQRAELNNPDLSYLLLPKGNQLFIVYNHMDGNMDPMATATTLNLKGQTTDDHLVFWEMNKMLNFQQSRRFSANEVAVPYMKGTGGFAIIHLQ